MGPLPLVTQSRVNCTACLTAMMSIPLAWMPGILSPRVKYSVFEELRSAEVPIPYLLFSQTNTHGRSHSFACDDISIARNVYCSTTHHVERLEDLTLVAGTVSVHRVGSERLVHVFLCKRKACADGHLRTDDSVATEERLGEDVHGTTLAVGHARLAAKQLTDDALDRAATEDGEGVTTVRSDDFVIRRDSCLETDRNRLLQSVHTRLQRCEKRIEATTYLSNRQVAEATDELLLVQRVGGHLHAAHGLHGLVHVKQLILGGLDLQAGRVGEMATEGVFMQLDGERLGVVGIGRERGRVRRRLDPAHGDGLEHEGESASKIAIEERRARWADDLRNDGGDEGCWSVSGRARPWREEERKEEGEEVVGERKGVEYESHHFAYSIPSRRSHWLPPGKLGLDGPCRLAPVMATLYDPLSHDIIMQNWGTKSDIGCCI